MWAWTIQKLMRCYGGMGMGRQSWSRPSFNAANENEQVAFAEKMGPILAEFELTRKDTFNQVEASAKIWVPIGLAAGLIGAVAATYFLKGNENHFVFVLVGLAGGMYMATRKPVRRYEDAFKSKVMPHLLQRFGDFKLLSKPTVSVAPLIDANILPGGRAAIEDEISGHYRGRTIAMAELEITSEQGDDTVNSFDGLILKFELPREVSGRTIIYPKSWDQREKNQRTSFLGKAKPEHDGLEPVALESPEFAERYTVRSTDQVGARVLLRPAFMERLVQFEVRAPARNTAKLGWFENSLVQASRLQLQNLGPDNKELASRLERYLENATSGRNRLSDAEIVAIAENGQLLIAIPKEENVDYFEPPPYWIETNADAVLMHLSIDIQNMLDIADAVFDLDYRTRVDYKSGRVLRAA